MPEFGWYPIEPTLGRSPWPNEYQVNVAIIPPEYESQKLAENRMAASGVPYLSLTEMPEGPAGVFAKGNLGPRRNCDHECSLVRKFATDDGQWEHVLAEANSRWREWLASKPQSDEKGQLVFGPKTDAIKATSASELMGELRR